MNKNLTDLTLIVDRSGSMAACRSDAEGGINTFIEGQKKLPGHCLLSLVQFDTHYEFVHRGRIIVDIPPYKLIPRGNTALLDAVGRAINETGERLAAMDEPTRPGLVVFVIVTDGQENSSHEFTKAQIKELIERQQQDYQWQFTFLGANQDAFHEAASMGIAAAGAANVAPHNVGKSYRMAGANVMRMREASAGGQAVCSSYTDEERSELEK